MLLEEGRVKSISTVEGMYRGLLTVDEASNRNLVKNLYSPHLAQISDPCIPHSAEIFKNILYQIRGTDCSLCLCALL